MSATHCGLSRFAFEAMDQRISGRVISEITGINPAVIAAYRRGRRIARHHLAILAVLFDIPPDALLAPVPNSLVYVDENELSEANPLPIRYHPKSRWSRFVRYTQTAASE